MVGILGVCYWSFSKGHDRKRREDVSCGCSSCMVGSSRFGAGVRQDIRAAEGVAEEGGVTAEGCGIGRGVAEGGCVA